MKITLRYLVLLLSMLAVAGMQARVNFSNETLRYVITYKWGLIHKDAGEAVMTLKNVGNDYNITLTGKTKPWADGFYKVRDTLVSVIDKATFRPKIYMKMAHEGGDFAKDVIKYTYSGGNVTGNVTKYREKKKSRKSSDIELNATGPTFDMLSVFYYLRTIDPSKLESGQKITSTLFSGSHAETVTIWKVKEGEVKMRDGSVRQAWLLKFKFTTKGGKKSSSDIDAWISKDDLRIPLYLKGSLPIGNVNAYLL